MPEERKPAKHKLVVNQRESVAITGVLDVISFDEEQVVCETDMGVLILRGVGLHVNNLNLESGLLDIFGEVIGITYEDHAQAHAQGGRGKTSFLGRIFK